MKLVNKKKGMVSHDPAERVNNNGPLVVNFYTDLLTESVQKQAQQSIVGQAITQNSLARMYENVPIDTSLTIGALMKKIKKESIIKTT